MGETPSRLAVIIAWASYVHALAFLLYFERVLFNQHVREWWQYVLLAGMVAGGYAGGHALARLAPPRLTLLALLASLVSLSGLALAIAWATPLGPASFTCPGGAWACAAWGQAMLCTIVLGIMPPLLVAVTASYAATPGEAGTNAAASTTLGGALVLGWGLLATVHPTMAPLGACTTAAVAGALLPALARDAGNEPRPSEPAPRGGLLAVRAMLLALVLAATGFSMFRPGGNVFAFMPGLGAGIAASGAWGWLSGKATGKGVSGTIATQEIIVLAALGATAFTTAWLAWEGIELRVATGMHHAITGLGLGFAWTRLSLASAGVPYMPAPGKGTIRGVSTRGATSWWFFLFSFVVALGTLVTVWPTAPESVYLHAVATALCISCAACWLVSSWRARPAGMP